MRGMGWTVVDFKTGSPDDQEIVECRAAQEHEDDYQGAVDSPCCPVRRTGMVTGLSSLRAALRRSEEHVADPRAGDAGRDAGQYGMPLEDGGITLGRRGRTGRSWWRRGRLRLGRGRLLDRLPGVLIVGA